MLVLGGCLGAGVLLLCIGLFLAGVVAGIREDSGSPAAPAGGRATPGPTAAAPAPPSGPDDFIYHSPNGTIWIAPHQVSAEGVSVTLAGEWREDQRNVILRLREDGRYDLSVGGGAISGRNLSDLVAANSAEQGTWSLEGATLTLAPDGYDVSAIAERRSSTGGGKADPPRRWNLVGVTIDYTPHGSETARQRPGLRITGPGPSWHYPPGEWNWVLRRAW